MFVADPKPMREMRESLRQMRRTQQAIQERLEDLALRQRTLTAIVVEALTQLNLSRTYEKRLQRLEDKVFGPGV